MSKQSEVPSWVKDRKQWHIAHSNPEYLTVPEGETAIEVDLNHPAEEKEGDYGKQFMYRIKVDGKQYLLSASITLDRLIISALSEGINPMTLIRTGTKKQTRYSIKELAKRR
jgi:hypothetical protein